MQFLRIRFSRLKFNTINISTQPTLNNLGNRISERRPFFQCVSQRRLASSNCVINRGAESLCFSAVVNCSTPSVRILRSTSSPYIFVNCRDAAQKAPDSSAARSSDDRVVEPSHHHRGRWQRRRRRIQRQNRNGFIQFGFHRVVDRRRIRVKTASIPLAFLLFHLSLRHSSQTAF